MMLKNFLRIFTSFLFVFSLGCTDVKEQGTWDIIEKSDGSREYFERDNWTQESKSLGVKNKENSKARHKLEVGNDYIYNLTYELDNKGRRKMEYRERENLLLVFGCSFVFGNGLPNKETLPSFLQDLMKDFDVLNYGVMSQGTHGITRKIETTNFEKEYPGKKKIGLYVFFDDHLYRSIGDSIFISTMENAPLYDFKNGEFKYLGSFIKAQPFRTWFFKKWNSVVGELTKTRIPFILTDNDIERTCQMVKLSQKSFERNTNHKFYTVIHPLSGYLKRESEEFISCLKRNKIPVINLLDTLKENTVYRIPLDGHPNAQLNKEMAANIFKYLKNLP